MADHNSKGALRILLVSTVMGSRDAVGEALSEGYSDYRLHWVSQPDLVLTRAQDLFPQVILLDDVVGEADAIALTNRMAKQMPDVAVVVLVESDAMDLARRAVLAGARGFVAKPLQAGDLENTLRQVLTQSRTPHFSESNVETEEAINGRIIAFCAPKGGTGRTTLAINTSLALQTVTKEPLALVDADYAAPALDVALNLHSERNISDLLSRLSRLDEELLASVLAKHTSGMGVLLAPPPGDLSNPIPLPQVQDVLAQLMRMYPWVVVDLGLPLDETAFAFLDGADRIVMSVLPEMVGLRNTRLMLDQLHNRGYPAEKIWLVLNRATIPGGITMPDIEQRLRVRVRHHIPDDQALATHSINRGVPLMMSHRRSAVGRAILNLAQELATDLTAEAKPVRATVKSGGGLMGRLLRGSSFARA